MVLEVLEVFSCWGSPQRQLVPGISRRLAAVPGPPGSVSSTWLRLQLDLSTTSCIKLWPPQHDGADIFRASTLPTLHLRPPPSLATRTSKLSLFGGSSDRWNIVSLTKTAVVVVWNERVMDKRFVSDFDTS